MAATVVVKQVTGPTGSRSNDTITNLRFSTDDNYNPGVANPMVRPAAGVNRSFFKTIYLYATVTPTGTINNVKLYCDGSIGWTGITVYVGTTNTYTQAGGTEGTTGTDSSVATADIENFPVATPKSITGSLDNPSTGTISDYVVLQADLSTSVSPGTLSAETLTFQYDET